MSRSEEEVLVPGPAQGLAGLLDASDLTLGDGDTIPLLWHWVYLLERPASAELGADGHPSGGIAEPPGHGSRRMWAGGRVTRHHPLVLGRHAERRSEVVDRRQREGRSGRLTFVTIRHEISQDGQVAVEEFQDVVYRAPAPAGEAGADAGAGREVSAGEPEPAVATGADAAGYHPPAPDEVTLFRMSALTYNSHRIHYDRDFARKVDGYPDLVVHGPLQALYMLEAARRSPAAPGGPVTACSYRMVSPLLLGAGLELQVAPRPGGVAVTVSNRRGIVTSSGTFDWSDPVPG